MGMNKVKTVYHTILFRYLYNYDNVQQELRGEISYTAHKYCHIHQLREREGVTK